MSVREILAGRAVVELGLRNKLEAGLKSARAKLQRFSSSLSAVGSSFAGIGGAAMTGLGAPLAAVGVIFGGFDGKMAEVAAVSGATGNALDGLRQKAKQLGATTRFSATEAAEGMKFLAMAGMSDEQIMEGIGPVLMTAAAGGMELGRAADIISDVTTAFGLSATQTARVADVLAATATSSNTSIEQMGEAFTYAAAQGKAAGQTVEDVSAALGILGNSGLKASLAGSGVQGIFKRLIQPEAIASLRQLGVSIADSAGNIRPLSALMGDLAAKTAGMTQLKKLQKFEELFGLHAKSAIILADNSAALGKMTVALQNADGKAAAMAATMNNSVIGQFLGLKSAAESVLIEIGEAIKGPMMAVLSIGAQVGRAVAAFISANKPLVKWIGIIMAAGTALGGVLLTLGLGFLATSAIISGVVTGIAGVLGLLSGLAYPLAILAALTGAIYLFRDSIYAWRISLLAPLAPVMSGLISMVQNFGAIFGETFAGVGAMLASGNLEAAGKIAMAGLTAAFWQGVADIGGVATTLLDMLGSWIPGLDSIRKYAGDTFASIGTAILAGRWDLAGAIIMQKLNIAITTGWNKIKFLWSSFTIGIITVFESMGATLRSSWRTAIFGIAKLITWLGEKLGLMQTGTTDMIADMEKQAQSADDKQVAARGAARLAAAQEQLDAARAGERTLRDELRTLEAEAAAAHAADGSPTLDDKAARARHDLLAQIERAKAAGKADPAVDDEKLNQLAAAGAGGQSAVSKLASTGTFSAAAAQLTGVGSKPMEETARNTAALLGVAKKQLKQKPPAQPAFAP